MRPYTSTHPCALLARWQVSQAGKEIVGTVRTCCGGAVPNSSIPLANPAVNAVTHLLRCCALVSSPPVASVKDDFHLSQSIFHKWSVRTRAMIMSQNQFIAAQSTNGHAAPALSVTLYGSAAHNPAVYKLVRSLHGMVSVMTAAEAARDLLSAITHPVSYTELAAHMVRDYSVELFDSLSGLILCHLDELNGPELSNLLWAYGTVGHRDLGLAACVTQSLLCKISELAPAELANVLWALQRLGIYDSQFVSSASEHVWDRLPAATPRQLAAMVQSYAWFRQQDPQLEEDEDLMRSIAAKFRQQLSSASATEIALVLSGMARLRRADEALLADACAVLRGMVDSTELPSLAEAIWSCALLQHRDLELMEVVAERVSEALRRATGLTQPTSQTTANPGNPYPLTLQPGGGGSGVLSATVATGKVTGDTPSKNCAPAEKATECSALASRGTVSVVGLPRRQELPTLSPTPSSWQPLAPPQQQQEQHLRHWSSPHLRAQWKGDTIVPIVACNANGAQQHFSSLWPTRIGPGGRSHPCSLYERFNPCLLDDWQNAPMSGSAPSSHAPPGPLGEGSGAPAPAASNTHLHTKAMPHGQGSLPSIVGCADAAALLDADVVSKLLWSYGALHCYSNSLYTLLFRQLQRLHPECMSWSALARLMGAQVKVVELQSSPGNCRINPLEAESVTAWTRLMRTRLPAHKLPERYLAPCFVAFHAEQMARGYTGLEMKGEVAIAGSSGASLQQQPGSPISRATLQAEVATTLRDMGLQLRQSASVDGLFSMEHTILINGLTICLEVLAVGCCTLDPPHRPMGPSVARLRSLEFRGWTPLIVPFYEWAALAPEENGTDWARSVGPDGEHQRQQVHQATNAARHAYLRLRLEDLLGEQLPPMLTSPKHRVC
ncbi:hypothetical protein Vafri_2898 [Volvox africanus]|uniref:RAP domain-containing protein n=1 Tax=Volvox africanus TaxID=51714 RepID=A0A8J4ESA8_9CHLO|nr:hypothetical protein Vafri_2898 [Volvox africanus]